MGESALSCQAVAPELFLGNLWLNFTRKDLRNHFIAFPHSFSLPLFSKPRTKLIPMPPRFLAKDQHRLLINGQVRIQAGQ